MVDKFAVGSNLARDFLGNLKDFMSSQDRYSKSQCVVGIEGFDGHSKHLVN